MTFTVLFKSKWTDKVLTPVRRAVLEQIGPGVNLLEIACGTGDLLIRASTAIKHGVGIDVDVSMIEFANKTKKINNIRNLTFVPGDASELNCEEFGKFDIATCSLFFHEIPEKSAVSILKKMANLSSTIVVVDYAVTNNKIKKIIYKTDEIISRNYRNYKNYMKNGGVPSIAKQAGIEISANIHTSIDGINLWMLCGKPNIV